MTAITFDTLKFANRLKSAGVPDKQAEVMVEVQTEIFDKNLEDVATRRDLKGLEESTKRDLKEMRLEIDARLEKVFGELLLVKWMLGILLAGVMTLILKAFFPH